MESETRTEYDAIMFVIHGMGSQVERYGRFDKNLIDLGMIFLIEIKLVGMY
jgi:hypothetical protein